MIIYEQEKSKAFHYLMNTINELLRHPHIKNELSIQQLVKKLKIAVDTYDYFYVDYNIEIEPSLYDCTFEEIKATFK